MWADMIAVASAHVVCLRHQLQQVTMEMWRADLRHVVESSRCFSMEAFADNVAFNDARLTVACASIKEKRRALQQQWLYESQYEDAFFSGHMDSDQHRFEDAARELGTLQTISISHWQSEKRHDFSGAGVKSHFEVQWFCQFALVRHFQMRILALQRAIEQGKSIREVQKVSIY